MAENTNMDYSLERADPSDATIGGELSQVFGEESYVQTDPKDPFYVEKVSPFPALAPREDVKFEYEDFSLGAKDSVLNLNTIIRGVRTPVARNREVVNPNLLTPIFKTADFFDTSNADDAELLRNATGFMNKDEMYFALPGDTLEQKRNMPIDQKLAFADRVQAVQVSNQYGDTVKERFNVKIPFEKMLTKEIAIPEGLEGDVKVPTWLKSPDKSMGKSNYELYVDGGADPKLTAILYARQLNQGLIKLGVKDARTRLAIIMREKSLGNRMNVMGSDISKLAGRAKMAIRFPFQMGAYIGGEVFQALTGIDGIGNMSDSEWRNEFFERLLPEYASQIQDRFAQMNVNMKFSTAQYLAGYYSGIGTQGIGLALDIVVPSKIAMRIKAMFGEGKISDYRQYVAGQKSKGINKTDDEYLRAFTILQEDRAFEATSLSSPLLLANVFRVSNLTKPIADGAEKARIGINRIFVSSRLQAGLQLEQAAKTFAGSRPEVAALINTRMDLKKQRRALQEKSRNEGGNPDVNKQIKELDDQIQELTFETQVMISKSRVPRFMREADVQNKFMLMGGSVMAQLFQQYNLDPAMGEMAGIFTGLFYMMGGKATSTGIAFVGNKILRTNKQTMNFATELAKRTSTFTPEFRAAVLERLKYYENIQQVITQELKVSPDLVQSTFAKISCLAYLQLLEESTRLNIKAKELIDFEKLEELTKLKEMQNELIVELRTGLQTLMTAKKDSMSSESTNLLKMVQSTLNDADSSLKQLDFDIKTVTDFGAKRIEDLIYNRTGKDSFLSPSANKSLDLAIENITNNKIKLLPQSETIQIKKSINGVGDNIYKAIKNKSNELLGKFPLSKALKQTQKALGTPLDKGIFDDSGNLLALLLETNKGSGKVAASVNFNLLNNAKFVDQNGKFIGGNATTDGAGILMKLIDETKIDKDEYLITLLKGSGGVSSGTQTRLFNVLNKVSMNYINEFASKKGKTGAEVLSDTLDALKDTGDYLDYLPDALNVVYHLQKNAPDGLVSRAMPMSFEQIKEFRSAVSNLEYKARQSGNDNAARIYNELDVQLEGSLNNFVVKTDDGRMVNVGQLFVKRDGKTVPASQVITDANADWSDYKGRFYYSQGKGNQLIAGWMGRTGNTSREHNKQINIENPTGIKYGSKNQPRSWLDFNSYLKMDANTQKTTWIDMQKGFGTKQTKDNQYDARLHGAYVIDPDSEKGKAFSAILNNKVAQWTVEQIEKTGDIDSNKLQAQLHNLSQFFMGTDLQGNKKSLLNVQKIFQEKFEYGESTVGKKYFNTGESRKDTAIKFNVNRLKNYGATIKQGIIDAKKLLSNYDPQRVRAGDVSDILFENGGLRIDEFKKALNEVRKRSGKKALSDKDLNIVFENVLLDTIDTQVFIPTGKMNIKANRVNPEDPFLIPETTIDLEKMKLLVGYGDNAKADAVRKIVGEKRYKVYRSMIELLENEKQKPFNDVNITGIPRAFSVESWISRFYAIQRNVIGVRYVGTEAILQQMRLSGMKTMRAMLQDPKAAELFMKVLKTGKPLVAAEEKAFFNAMVTQFATWQTHANVLTTESFGDNVRAMYMPDPTSGKKYKEFKTPFSYDYTAKDVKQFSKTPFTGVSNLFGD